MTGWNDRPDSVCRSLVLNPLQGSSPHYAKDLGRSDYFQEDEMTPLARVLPTLVASSLDSIAELDQESILTEGFRPGK